LTRSGPAPQPWQPEPVSPDATVISYESGWVTLKAWVSRGATQAGSKKPGVLFLHGGFAFGADDWEQAEPFRRAGFHVMVPILRGENGQPGSFSLHVGEVDDALAAAAAFEQLPGVDGKNLFVSGHSVGGTLALFVALSSDKFRASAPISGAPDCGNHIDGQTELAPFDATDPLELRARSPGAFARYFKCSVRAYYGTDEADFFDPDTRSMAQVAQASGKDVKAVRLPGDHMSVVGPAMKDAIAFFRGHMTK
jgi:dipeptidyl aminopeptidase/acylaminoacyl peptidase